MDLIYIGLVALVLGIPLFVLLLIINSSLCNHKWYRKLRGGKWTLHRRYDTSEEIWIRYSKHDDKSFNTIKIEDYNE